MQHSSYLLEVHFVDGRPAQTFPFGAGIRIGRDAGDIVLRDPQASALHCEIEFANGQLIVRDLGSTNGTYFREQRQSQFAVAQGQEFRVGHTRIRVVQVLGAQAVVAGRTLMAEGAALPRPAPPHQPGAPMHPGTRPAGTVTAPAQGAKDEKGKGGLIAGMAILGVLALAGAGGAYWYFVMKQNPPGPEALADAESDGNPDEERSETGDEQPPGETGGETPPQPELQPILTDNEPGLPPDLDLGELYKTAGAATVVVRVPGSVGSGAVIDPSGVVLTNHHVVDGGKLDGLTAKVKVVLGRYSDEIRAFEPVEDQYDGVVIKYDQERDLALVRIEEPPADLAAVELAGELPHPGQRVAAIGHAGAGMLWAIKSGEVSATGSLAGHTDLMLQADDGFDKHELERMKAQIEAGGRVIQSTAKILPGDSGGPLLDMQGDIVGVNAFGRIDNSTGQWLSFHVHLEEVRDFTSVIPERPVAFIPSPWSAGGLTPELDDIDLDGKMDTLVLGAGSGSGPGAQNTLLGAAGWACFLDLDQDSFSGDTPKAETVYKDRNFDAEVIVLYTHGKRHFWYDRDGDGSMDAYLVDNNASGKVNSAYKLDPNGAADADPSVKLTGELADGLDSSLIEDPAQRERFDGIGSSIFPDMVHPKAGNGAMPAVFGKVTDDPILSDSDYDGHNDTVAVSTSYAQRILWDLDEDSVSGKSPSAIKNKIESKDLDIELATIVQGSTMWMVYDRDNDGAFDLALQTVDLESGVAQFAMELDGDKTTPVRGYAGRELLRPALMNDEALGKSVVKTVLSAGVSSAKLEDGMSSFPAIQAGPIAHVRLINFPGWERSVAFTTEKGFDITLVDVDKTSSKYADDDAAISAVKDGSFDAEFALVRHGSMEWAYYDTDDDGAFDLVRFALNGTDEPEKTETYTVDRSAASLDQAQDGKPLLEESKFSKHGSKFAEIAKKLFPGRVN